MAPVEIIQRVRIYLSQSDQFEGRPRYLALLDQLRLLGATGATALQALAGFGPGQRVRAGAIDRPEDHRSVVVEWVDRPERISRLLPIIDSLLGSALVTLEDVPVYRATLRTGGPFSAGRSVGDSMRSPAITVQADEPLSAALALMVHQQSTTLPVCDAAGRLVGLLGEQDLAWRAQLRIGVAVLAILTDAERDSLLSPLIGRSVAEVMSSEVRSVYASTAISQALATMLEWGYSHIPVLNRDGVVVGQLGEDEVLRAALAQVAPSDSGVRDADPPAPVRLVMQTIAPHIAAGQPLNLAFAQLLAAPGRQLIVLGPNDQLRGTIAITSALERLDGAERAALMNALQQQAPPPLAALPGADRSLDELVVAPLVSVMPDDSALAAGQRLIDLGVESLPVADADGRFLGIIARGGLVRALMQASDA